MALNKGQNILGWVLRASVAFILLQTLFFKFTGAPEPVYIFETVGAEPWGRIGSGIVEGIAAILLLMPSTVAIGALVALGVMVGAIGSHLRVLGIEVMGDGGTLFGMAIYVFLASATLLFLYRASIPMVGAAAGSR